MVMRFLDVYDKIRFRSSKDDKLPLCLLCQGECLAGPMYQSCIDLPLPTIRKSNILAASEVPRHDGHHAVTVSKEPVSYSARQHELV